ncbi:MAG: hypothetical protein OEV01_08455 [Nitrospira sp.]|nr:hypothetical protein [Nitrospira sp.]
MNAKSRLLIAACGFLLTTQFASAAQIGLPPAEVGYTVTIDAKSAFYACEFNVSLSVAGKGGAITLPNGRFIYTSPAQSATLINLDNPQKQVMLNITGSTMQSTNAQGNQVFQPRGRNLLGDPGQTNENGYEGLVLAIGNFSYVFDSNGNLIQPLKGQGTITNVCDLIR